MLICLQVVSISVWEYASHYTNEISITQHYVKKAFTEIWLWAKSWARENKLIHLWQIVHSKINQGLAIMSRSTDISFTSDLSWHFYQWSSVGMISLTSPAKTSFVLYLRDMRKKKEHSWTLSAASLQLFNNLSLKKEERGKITSPPWHYSVIIPAAVTCKIPHLRSPLRPYLWLKPIFVAHPTCWPQRSFTLPSETLILSSL